MVNAIVILILILIAIFAIRGTIKHMKGESPCCGGGVNRVMRALNKIDGVSANVSLKGKRAVVSYDREIDVNVLKKAVEDAGYTVESIS